MPLREPSQTIRNSFNKGLLTEFSPLNFPEEASIDELNCSLFKAGNRTRRLAVEYEEGYSLSTDTHTKGKLFGVHKWENVAREGSVEYAVVQSGRWLYFYEKGPTLSENPVPTSNTDSTPLKIDMRPFNRVGGTGAGTSHIDVASVSGQLVVVSPQIESFYIRKNKNTGIFTTTLIEFEIRDFEFQATNKQSLLTDSANNPPSVERQYDTYNCGWEGNIFADNALATYTTANLAWPPLTHPWYSGKDSVGNFDQNVWKNIYAGTTLAVNGHFILNLFEQDRNTASGLTGLETKKIEDRFSTVAAFAGRAFYAGADSRVYFSQLSIDFKDLGSFYQRNDPTAETFSDLLDTDGGWINIPEASGINKLHVFGSSLLVFADNGVWRISGVDQVFRATEFSVFRITDEGLSSRMSFVSGENGVPFWWSYNGIHTIQVTDDGGLVAVNLSRDTVQTFWNSIGGEERAGVVATHDDQNDRVVWMYPNEGETVNFKLNRMLILDVRLGAFYPWTISDAGASSPYIVSGVFFNSSGSAEVDYTVIDDSDNVVVDSSGNTVVATKTVGTIGSSAIKFLTWTPSGQITFSTFTDTSFLDWGSADYNSFAEAGYNFIGDLGRKKNSPYITTFLQVTETGWEAVTGGYTPVRNSSCLVSTYWDFRNIPSSSAQQVYRFKYPLVVDTSDLGTFTYPTDAVITRLKTRGRGRVMRVKFESETGKDFNILGWETLDDRKQSY